MGSCRLRQSTHKNLCYWMDAGWRWCNDHFHLFSGGRISAEDHRGNYYMESCQRRYSDRYRRRWAKTGSRTACKNSAAKDAVPASFRSASVSGTDLCRCYLFRLWTDWKLSGQTSRCKTWALYLWCRQSPWRLSASAGKRKPLELLRTGTDHFRSSFSADIRHTELQF